MKSSAHTVVAYLRSLAARHGGAADADRQLLRRFAEQRDGDALAVLMHRHGPMVFSLARRITDDEQLAEDVFQAAFLLLARKAHTIRRPESLPCWLHGVARRLALQGRRGRQRRRQRESQVQPISSPSPLDELTVRECLTILDEELQQLPENQRAPLILCCLEGLSREEAAKRLGCSCHALKGRLERGRERLRLRLQKRGLTLPAALGGTLLIAGAASPVPAALAQATLQAATTASTASPAVAVLIEAAMRSMFLHKLKIIGEAALLLALSGTGIGMMALRPQTRVGQAFQPDGQAGKPDRQAGKPDLQSPVAASDDKPLSAKKHVDLYGDPLPDGAVLRLGTLRRRAAGMNLAVTADGKSIVGARNFGCLSIWDAATGELRQKRELPVPGGRSILSPDGRWLATLGESLEIWDVRTVEKCRVLGTKQEQGFWPIAFSRDSKRVAAIGRGADKKGGYNNLVCVWNLADGKELFRTVIHHTHPGYSLAFSPDGNRLLATFPTRIGDRGLYCWDIAAGRQAWLNKEITSPVSVVFTTDGKILTWPWGQTVDLATGRTVELENPPPIMDKGGVDYWEKQLAMTSDGRTLFIPKTEGVIVWDMIQGKQRRMLQGAGEEVVVMPDGKSIITNNGSLQRWDLETGKPLWQDTFSLGHIGQVGQVAFSANGKRMASASEDGSFRLWDAATGQPLRVWRAFRPQRNSAGARILDISPDGRWILAGWHESITLWDASSGKEVRSMALPPHDRPHEADLFVHDLRIRADGSQAVALFGAMWNPPTRHKLVTWDVKTGQMLACHTFKQCDPRESALSPDGRLLLHNGDLVDTASGRKIARLEGPPIWPCAFSRDGALVIGIPHLRGQDGLRVCESATGKTVAHVKPEIWIHQVAFHPNNRLLAANAQGIELHDAVTGKRVAVRTMPKDVTSNEICFAFAPDGRRLATGMPDGTILMWDIPLPPSQLQRLEVKEIESLWADLADADAAKAWRAVWQMADAPQQAMGFLRGRVRPYPTAVADVTRKLLADLDSDSFEVREAAMKRLKELGLQAEPALRAALSDKPSLELRRRIKSLLTALAESPQPLTPQQLRQLRALIVLERIGTTETRRLLEEAAKGPPSAALTQQAQAVLECLP